MQISFLGATETVTGSKYLLEIGEKKILIDCGLFQGLKELRLRNWNPLPIDPAKIDAVVLTHAHIDHTGYLPLLVKNGFTGPIYATHVTKELCAVLLPDSGHLQEEEALFANRHGYSKHHPALPLYTKEDAEKVLKQFVTRDWHKKYSLFDNCQLQFYRAGHILGAAFVQLNYQYKSILFSGDIGRPHDPVLHDPEKIQHTDYLVIESTYGDRLHHIVPPLEHLKKIINETAKRSGVLVIPAFAVGRAQNLLYYLYQLKQLKAIPDLPIFLDSPMAINATHIFTNHLEELRISKEVCEQVSNIATYTNSTDESKEIDTHHNPMIIISASGMVTGGRVLHHLKTYAPDERNTILLTGFQAAGTRGARIQHGEKEIKMLGEMVPIRAHVEYLSNLSAHADYQEILDWLANFTAAPKKVFITHGEPKASAALKEKIEQRFGWTCELPEYLEKVNL